MDNLKQEFEMNKRKIPEFIVKLYHILQQNEYREIICWVNEDTEVVIKNQKKLQDKVLPYFFRHKHITSFIRQLNMYGFNKVIKLTKEKNHTYFNNPLFKRGSIHQLTKIKRKSTKKTEEEIKMVQNQAKIKQEHMQNDENQRVLSNTSENQSVTPQASFNKQVFTSIETIEQEVQKIIETINFNNHERKKCLRKNKYNKQFQQKSFLSLYNAEDIEEAVKKLKIVRELCKNIKGSAFNSNLKIPPFAQYKNDYQSEYSIMQNDDVKIEDFNQVNLHEYEEKPTHKEINMFKSMMEIFPKLDSFPCIASICSLDRQNCNQN